jgi:hypothetical protein
MKDATKFANDIAKENDDAIKAVRKTRPKSSPSTLTEKAAMKKALVVVLRKTSRASARTPSATCTRKQGSSLTSRARGARGAHEIWTISELADRS